MSKAVLNPSLSCNGEDRWVIIDEQTGEILDDAQGYGYKSAQKAHAGYAYCVIFVINCYEIL